MPELHPDLYALPPMRALLASESAVLAPETSRQRFDATFLKVNVSVVPETSVTIQAWVLLPLQSWISLTALLPSRKHH